MQANQSESTLEMLKNAMKVIVADSRYEDRHFLGIFQHFQRTFGLIRLHGNRTSL